MPTTTNHRAKRHLRLLCVGAAVVGAALAAGWAPVPPPKARKAPTAEGELARLQGEWEEVIVYYDGDEWDRGERGVGVFQGDRHTRALDGEVTARWKVALDPSKRPKAMTLKGDKGELLCAYELKGDRLTLAYSPDLVAKRRPADVEPRRGVCVVVLQRVKPKPKAP